VTGLPIHDPVLIFALVMLAILVVPIACRLARLPAAFGLIVAGVVLGPHALDVLERDAQREPWAPSAGAAARRRCRQPRPVRARGIQTRSMQVERPV
jgi:hypothetical protein